MKTTLRIVAIALLAAAILWLVPSEKVIAEGAVVPIPLEASAFQDSAIRIAAPQEKYYTEDGGYSDPSIRVRFETGFAFDTDYMVAYVQIADPSQIRSYMVDKRGANEDSAIRMAARAGSVLALTADSFYDNKQEVGKYIVRQGTLIKNNLTNGGSYAGYFDVLVVDEKGNLIPCLDFKKSDMEAFEASFEGTIVNSYCFGPALVVNGAARETITDSLKTNGVGWYRLAKRIAICQMGPLSYAVVSSAAPDFPRADGQGMNKGFTLDELTQVILGLGDVQTAYNLDGGTASWLVFHGQKLDTYGNDNRTRSINGIISFVSAWQE